MSTSTRNSFQRIWTIAIVICVILAIIALFFTSCTKAVETADRKEDEEDIGDISMEDDGDADEGTSTDDTVYVPEATPEPDTMLATSEDMGEDYISQMMFLGDTTIFDLVSNDVLESAQVISTANGTLSLSNQGTTYVVYHSEDGSTQEMQLTNAISRAQPEYLVITLGLTNLTTQSEREFKLLYTQLIQSIQSASPDTKIICQSIFPVIESQLDSDTNIDNEMIGQANSWILDVASQTSVRYLNTYEILINSEGQLVSEYCTGDGMHLSTKGGEAMLDYIRTHAYV